MSEPQAIARGVVAVGLEGGLCTPPRLLCGVPQVSPTALLSNDAPVAWRQTVTQFLSDHGH
eukprot:8564857-Pyramimonas_sp.AAC.1